MNAFETNPSLALVPCRVVHDEQYHAEHKTLYIANILEMSYQPSAISRQRSACKETALSKLIAED